MSVKYFIDTNIIIYSFDNDALVKKDIALALIKQALMQQVGCISYQVTQETLNVLVRKFHEKLTTDDVKLFLQEVLSPLQLINPSCILFERAISIQSRWKYSFYDSLIIAGALESNCNILYSEDLHDGQKIEGLEIVNPFV